MQALNLPPFEFQIKTQGTHKYIFDKIRKKYVSLTPEEWVRQNFVRYLTQQKRYPPALMAVEMFFEHDSKKQHRSDIVVFSRKAQPVLIVECKAPHVKITTQTIEQIQRYNLKLRVKYLVVTNGLEHFCWRIDYNQNKTFFEKEIPEYTKI